MSFAKRAVILHPKFTRNKIKLFSTQGLPAINEEYTEKPVYPEILDLSIKKRKARETYALHKEIEKLKTIEEKQIKINMPRYWGFKTVMFDKCKFPYNSMSLTQHYTRTVFENMEKLPDSYSSNDVAVDSYVKAIKTDIEDTLQHANEFFKLKYENTEMSPQEKDKILGEILVEQINRSLINSLSADCHHLCEVETDLLPRHEACWFVGGVKPPKSVRKSKEGTPWLKENANDPVDRVIQYVGQPYLALRHRLPLKPFASENQSNNFENASKVPLYEFDPRTIGYSCDYRHLTNVPGFWPGSVYEFGLLSYQKRDHMIVRNPSYGAVDFQEALHVQGMKSSFAWLLGQACYQGFTTFNDLTYPLTTQTVITNGQTWSFYLYQLNTALIHSNHVHENPKVNFCWGTKEMKLFQEFDGSGRCVGFNDDVLKYLVHMYANAPTDRKINLKPFLGKDETKVADINEDERREFLENAYKNVCSNRPRHLPLPEIYMWEKIYKIDNKTRQLEPKRRFFELDINPWKRTLDQHTPVYIPRPIRPEGPKSKKKWKKTYYP